MISGTNDYSYDGNGNIFSTPRFSDHFRVFACILLILSTVSCSRNEMTIGTDVKSINVTSTGRKILIPSGSFENELLVINNGIRFNVVASKDSKVIFITTRDENFEFDGLKVGDTLSIVDPKIVEAIPGWGSFVELSSGWYAGFENWEGTVNVPAIQWFFQYEFPERNTKIFKD